MLSKPSPRKRERPAPIGIIVLILLLLASAWINHSVQHSKIHHPKLAETKTLMPPVLMNPLPVSAALPSLPFSIGESSGILWNLNTHQLLWQLHPHQPGPLASTTKLMTIYLALHQLPLNRIVTISPTAAGTTGSDMNMAPGETFTVKQLLYGLMMASANDSAVELAETMGGHTANFVAEMNHEAQALGMKGTHYADPDGLSPNSVGTAWDLSIIAEQDMQNPLFRTIVDTREASIPHNPVLRNLNGLLFLDPTVIGVKTGWTTQAGFNLVFAATRSVDGHKVTLLGVILHGQMGFPPEYTDAEKILKWGFSRVAQLDQKPPHQGTL